MKRTYLFLILISCQISLMASTITFDVLYPAEVQFDSNIKKVGIIDRSASQRSFTNTIEGILSGEGINQDKLASQIALDGLSSMLQNTSRFEVVRTSEIIESVKHSKDLPEPMDWNDVEELCKKYGVDALISLETFDSDFIVTRGEKPDQTGFYARGLALVHIGFRFYEPTAKAISDQFYFDYRDNWETQRGSIEEAITVLINKNQAVKEVSYRAGMNYGRRIAPSFYKVSREYFRRSKGDDQLAEGARMMESNDWDAAIQALEYAMLNGHKKTKGKAAHNLAVVYEITGDLERSKQYASWAWGKYKNKPSKDYAYEITKRMGQKNLVEQQLGMN